MGWQSRWTEGPRRRSKSGGTGLSGRRVKCAESVGEERSNLCVAKVRGKRWAKYMEGHLHAKGVLYHITLMVIEAYCGDKIHLTDIFWAGACVSLMNTMQT